MSDGKKLTVLLNDNDNVATALRDLDVGESTHNIKSINKIPKGHKISLRKIRGNTLWFKVLLILKKIMMWIYYQEN